MSICLPNTGRPIELLLSRLRNVRGTGGKFRADCPNGHERARQTLAIAEADDGRVLMRCFACANTPEILDRLGLTLADLFPQPVASDPSGRPPLDRDARRFGWEAALRQLDREAVVIQAACLEVVAGRALCPVDQARLVLACKRVAHIREVLA